MAQYHAPCLRPIFVANAANARVFAHKMRSRCYPNHWCPQMADLHIASCVVRVRPESVPAVVAPIEAIIGASIHAEATGGKLVVVIEGSSTGALLDQMDRIRNISGVLSIEMVYQHAEEESIMKEIVA